MAKFWSGLSQIAVKNDFINRNVESRDEETKTTIIGTTRAQSVERTRPESHTRGQGTNAMHGVVEERKRMDSAIENRSVNRQHNQVGTMMCQILRPEEETKELAQPREQDFARRDYFVRSSDSVGITERMKNTTPRQDPSELLRPDRNFRRANEASLDRLWTNEN